MIFGILEWKCIVPGKEIENVKQAMGDETFHLKIFFVNKKDREP